ncbi:MAG: alginate export family protein [Candidatus Polarisedimenticolia bacterium]
MKRFGLLLLGFVAIVAAGSLAKAADDDTDNKFTIHGEVRFRGEGWYNVTDFTDTDAAIDNTDTNDSLSLFPYRVRLAAMGDLGKDIWVFGEFQAAGVAGGGIFGEIDPLFGDETEVFGGDVSLYQGYVKAMDIGNSVTDLTFGRMEIVFDRGLQFSALEFYNGISHDAVMAGWDWESMGLHVFWIQNTELNLTLGTPTVGDADNNTLGVHWNTMVGEGDKQDVAAYIFYQIQNGPPIDPGQDRGKIYTIGGRWGRTMIGETGFLWNIEAAIQTGDVQPCVNTSFPFPTGVCFDEAIDLSAQVAEAAFGFNWHGGKTDQKVWVGGVYASGDDGIPIDPTEDELEAYQPLFPDFHNRLGLMDLLNVTNVISLSAGYQINVDDRHIFGVQFYDFSKAEENDTNFSPLTGVQITPSVADCLVFTGVECENDSIGQELDLWYTYAMTNNFSFDTAVTYFNPGDAVEDFQSTFDTIPGEEEFGEDGAYRIWGQVRARW